MMAPSLYSIVLTKITDKLNLKLASTWIPRVIEEVFRGSQILRMENGESMEINDNLLTTTSQSINFFLAHKDVLESAPVL